MRVAIICSFFVLVSSEASFDSLNNSGSFDSFNHQFQMTYRSAKEYDYRKEIFKNNLKDVIEHNERYAAGEVTWWKKVQPDSILTSHEWKEKRLGTQPHLDIPKNRTDRKDEYITAQLNKMDDKLRNFDWVSQGAVSSPKDQGQCGSCAAFAAIGAIESCYFIQTGMMDDDLSEQHILDCAYHHVVNDEYGSWEAKGCKGAYPHVYLDWLISGDRLNQEEDAYPYWSGITGFLSNCEPMSGGYHTESRVTGLYNVWYPTEISMMELVQINPVATAVSATENWRNYGGGILEDDLCCNALDDDSCVNKLNHAVLVVGYGYDEKSKMDFWLIKNSWSTEWGEEGFLKLKKGTGHCGIGSLHQTIPYCGQ